MKRIILFKEHHGERVFDISTQEQSEKMALSVIKGRHTGDNTYYPRGDLSDPEPPSMTDEQAAKLPPGPVRTAAMQELQNYACQLQAVQRERNFYARVDQAIAQQNGRLALRLLRERNGEDERYTTYDVAEEYIP